MHAQVACTLAAVGKMRPTRYLLIQTRYLPLPGLAMRLPAYALMILWSVMVLPSVHVFLCGGCGQQAAGINNCVVLVGHGRMGFEA